MRNWMTFYSFAITFRHEHIRKDRGDGCYHALNCERIFFFANQMYRDKKFPNNSNSYLELKHYVTENYSEDIVIGFELIWKKYKKAKLHALNEAHKEALAHNEKYSGK
ncbi:YozE family protein [Lysinibacillus sp. UGB7]|uniref:YozE family protein n=1 Tax=Lysinibacillus sp. UGB7 TaxID=3411039 RepID=UPI003B7842AF